jgi:CRP/FNR family transcriptional regulator
MTASRSKSHTLANAGEAGASLISTRTACGTRIDLGRRKQLAFIADAPDWIYVLERGCVTLDSVLPDDRRQVLLILYPGEMISRDAAPPMRRIVLTAMLPSVLTRLPAARESAGDGIATNVATGSASGPSRAIAKLLARASLHTLMIGRLSGEERLSSLLIEIALYLGTPVAGGYTVELPLKRDDMADYLALNPDTLSRMLSRLKSRNLISLPTRQRVIIKDFAALAKLSPLSEALQRLRAPKDEKQPAQA